MLKAPIPNNENERLCAVQGLKLLDTATEERFDRITKKALERFSVPISTITLIDRDREWFKSVQGLPEREGPRDISFCGHALMSEVMLIIEDTLLDSRFADNPMVKSTPNIRFYAGKSLYEKESNMPVGVFCIKDYKPRKMSLDDINGFLDLAHEAEVEINRKK
ncbi:MAG: GAF domain-containing protein [Candidatus Taylorbacteria bacterium]|nr:GAF domain-containing protein [Candidatus Taylorbacteria bacterium]